MATEKEVKIPRAASCFCGKTYYTSGPRTANKGFKECGQCGVFATHFSREQIGLGLPARKDSYIQAYDHPGGLSGDVNEP